MLDILFIFLMGILLGHHFGVASASKHFRNLVIKEARERGIQIDEEYDDADKKVMRLFVEKINGILYLYDYDKNSFICQGNSIEELAKLAKEYKDIRCAVVISDKTVYALLDGKVKIQK